jgi:hypothetical protein
VREPVDVARLEPPLRALRIDLDAEEGRARHRRRERLRAAHAAEPRREDPAPRPVLRPRDAVRREVLPPRLDERLVGALQDPLRADVDPRAGRHLPVHRQSRGLEAAELVPRRPVRHDERVREQHARRVRVRAEAPDGLARLHEQRLVVPELLELADDHVEGRPRARRFAGAAVDDEVVRPLGHLGVEVVHQHPQRGFLLPAAAAQGRSAWSAHGARAGRRRVGHGAQP